MAAHNRGRAQVALEALAVLGEAAEHARPNAPAGMVQAALAGLEALRGEMDRASAHLQSAKQMIAQDHMLSYLLDPPAAELAFTRGHPEQLRQIVDLNAAVRDSYPAFLVAVIALALRGEADLAQQAHATGEDAAERE